MGSNSQYSIGDWVVHKYYGVGQIQGIVARSIDGEQMEYFTAKTKDSTFWFPVEKDENPRIRLIGSERIIKKVIRLIRRKPTNLNSDREYWKERIAEAKEESDLISTSKVVRDLSAQKVVRKLNVTEERALDNFKDNLSSEWAAITDERVKKIQRELRSYIKESKGKIIVEE
jgi:RNA polymerase-interacting CarD/CdnL/TRCF family regulator